MLKGRWIQWLFVALALTLSQTTLAQTVPLTCDANGDAVIDLADINLITAARNQKSSGPNDPRDANADGKIDVADARTCTQRCTRTGCATANLAPVANAGDPQTVKRNTIVHLNGSKSTDVDLGKGQLAYLWSFKKKPVNSTAVISNPTSVLNASFKADLPGEYEVNLRVTDPQNASGNASVLISTTNSAPVANAGADFTKALNTTAQLDASGSTDTDGDLLTFNWQVISKPTLSTLTALTNANTATPSFVPDQAGAYTLRVTVSDGLLSSTDDVVVSTSNSKPVAVPGANQSLLAVRTVNLDGSASFDPDGEAIQSFTWKFISSPALSNPTFDNPNVAKPTFFASKVGDYVIELVVNDGKINSDAKTVTITASNNSPSANAGPDQSKGVGQLVQLDGSKSSDIDGQVLGFTWSFTQIPAALGGVAPALSNNKIAQPTFTPSVAGTYVLQLSVSDGIAAPTTDTVIISVDAGNVRPQATAEASPLTVLVGNSVNLSGSKSVDPDNGPSPLSYKWSLTAPAGSSATLTPNSTVANPSFVADKLGTYGAQLIVSDGALDSTPVTVSISTTNSKPASNAGPDQNNVVPGTLVTLNGAGSSDPDAGQTLSYAWSFTQNPGAPGVVLTNPNSVSPTFTPTVAGSYIVQLRVFDGFEFSSPDDTVVVNVVTPTPTAVDDTFSTLEDTALTVPAPAVLGNDQQNGGGALTAQLISPPASGLLNLNPNGGFTYTPAPNQNGAVEFFYSANNASKQSGPAKVIINITPVNDAPTLNAIANLIIDQNAGLQTVNLSGIGAGPATEGQTLQVSAVSNNVALIPNPAVTYTSPNATGSLSFTPVAGQSGVATITVTVKDNGGTLNSGTDTFQRQFNVTVNALPSVGITALNATAVEVPQQNGSFQITRTGSTTSALTVNLAVTGSATSGTDYTALGSSVTIPANQSSATVTVAPIADGQAEAPETVIATLSANAAYLITAGQSAATVTIRDFPASVVVPKVTGLTQQEATTALTGAGLIVGTVTTQASNSVPVGQVISQTPAAGGNAAGGSAVNLVIAIAGGGPIPSSLSLDIGPLVVGAGSTLTITPQVLDGGGNAINPTPTVNYLIVAPQAGATGTTPTVNGQQITIPTNTRGTFTLRGTVDGTAVTTDVVFTVIMSAAQSANSGLYVTLSASQFEFKRNLALISAALQAGNNAAIVTANAAMQAAAAKVKLDSMTMSSVYEPDSGFIPTTAQLATHGFAHTTGDTNFGTLTGQLRTKLQAISKLLNQPTGNDAADTATLTQLATDLQTLVTQTQAAANRASVFGLSEHSLAVSDLMAIDIPNVLVAMASRTNAQLKAAGLVAQSNSPATLYGQLGTDPLLGGPAAMYGSAQPVFLLTGLLGGIGPIGNLIIKIYGDYLDQVQKMYLLLAAQGLLNQLVPQTAGIDTVVTGASQSFQAYHLAGSWLEVSGLTLAEAKAADVFLVGGAAINAVTDQINAIKAVGGVKSIKDVYDFFQGMLDAVKGMGKAYNDAHQQPNSFDTGGCLFSGGNCIAFIYDSGFNYVGSGGPISIEPVIILVRVKSPTGPQFGSIIVNFAGK